MIKDKNRLSLNGARLDADKILNITGEFIDVLLQNRNIPLFEKDLFLSKDFLKNLLSPWKLKNCSEAVDFLHEAIQSGEKIIIFGDYDTDGIPASALMYLFLQKIQINNLEVIIPTRQDGYGLNIESIKKIITKKPKYVLLLDNGSNSFQEIAQLSLAHIKTCVIDHHEISSQVPQTIIVNHKQPDDKYPQNYLCATGLVYKVIQGYIERYLNSDKDWIIWWKYQLDLVALATVCDVVELLGENRILVDKGLIIFQKNMRKCFQKILDLNQIKPESISVYTLGFIIGPRINATGRISDSRISFEFLIDQGDSMDLAIKLNQLNSDRQEIFNKALKQAYEMISGSEKIVILENQAWQEGIVGLIAAKITEKYNVPSVIFSRNKDILTGSARSINGIDLVQLLTFGKKYSQKFGGHQKAAGVTLKFENFTKWKEIISRQINNYDSELFIPKIKPDLYFDFKLWDENFLNLQEQLAPFGMGNPTPHFLAKANLVKVNHIGKNNNHLQLFLDDSGKTYKSIAFDKSFWKDKLKIDKKYLFYYHITRSNWPGAILDFIIDDIIENDYQKYIPMYKLRNSNSNLVGQML